MVELGTHQCHHLHPLTHLAGSTLSDHFRDVNNGEKENHSRPVHLPLEIQHTYLDLTQPLPSFALIGWRMESNTPQTLSDRFRDANAGWLVGGQAAVMKGRIGSW